jgi:nitrilase
VDATGGATFDDPRQKEWFAHYADQSCEPELHFGPLRELAADRGLTVLFGCMERAADRGGHSLYCSQVTILQDGTVQPTHRKLMPTYEERLVWAQGDAHGLRVYHVPPFTVGALNCWENWMPLPRAALHAMGEDLHVMSWPGSRRNTEDITRFAAHEGRSFVLSASSLMRREDVAEGLPRADELRAALPDVSGDGGSCIAAPDGTWLVEPVVDDERLIVADLDHARVRGERQNFDISGHYARPELLHVELDGRRHRGLAGGPD